MSISDDKNIVIKVLKPVKKKQSQKINKNIKSIKWASLYYLIERCGERSCIKIYLISISFNIIGL
jgi:hypothetical protein